MHKRIGLIAGLGALLSLFGAPLAGEAEDEAFQWLTAFIGVDTVNPPGNEANAVRFYGKLLAAEGIAFETAESAPGRGNLWARLKGGDKPALILIQHTDVVPADPAYWATAPMTGTIKDGYLYGRGTLDMKGQGISHFAAFVALHRAGLTLNRDVIFVATADEEAGGAYGAGWLVEHHPEIFEGAGFVLNEGDNGTPVGDRIVFGVEVTQKVPVWFRLTATGTPGHGSTPNATNAVRILMQGIAAIDARPFPVRIIPAVDTYFKGLAGEMEGDGRAMFMDMAAALSEPDAAAALQAANPFYHALTRDTCTVTRLGASNKINVVPPVAWAEMDCRMLPDRPSAALVSDLEARLEGTGVTLELQMAFTPAVSPTDTELYAAIEAVTAARYPGSKVIPAVATGFTDSHFFRDLGIVSYGFDPLIMPQGGFAGVHGNNERVKIEAWRRALGDTRAIIEALVYD